MRGPGSSVSNLGITPRVHLNLLEMEQAQGIAAQKVAC
jgi:hypothetical protein